MTLRAFALRIATCASILSAAACASNHASATLPLAAAARGDDAVAQTSATVVASVRQSKLCNTDAPVTALTCALPSAVAAGDETVLLLGAASPASVGSGYASIGTAASSTSRVSAYRAASGAQSVTVAWSSATDAHAVVLEIAGGGAPTGFASTSGDVAPAVAASASSIVVDLFGEQYGYEYYGTVPTGWTEYYPPSPGSAGSGANQLDALLHPNTAAGTSARIADSPYLVAASFVIPSGTATTGPTPSPAPTATAKPTSSPAPPSTTYDSLQKRSPAGGSYAFYPSSPYRARLPASPVLVSSSQSAAWNAMQASDDFGPITASENGSSVDDGSFPTTYTNGDGTGYLLACDDFSYSHYSCDSSANVRPIDNATVKFPAGAITSGASDHQIVNIDVAAGIEDDIWLGRPMPTSAGGKWSVGGGGECRLAGNGVGCGGSNATNIAASLGLVRAEDVLACIASGSSTCTLPYAVSIALACNGNGVEFPATGSDAQCFGNQGTSTTRIAEGTRGCLALTDAQIDAASYRADEKVIYRTMDCSHYGVFDRDSAYAQGPGIAIMYQGAQAYAAFGEADPWRTLASDVGVSASNVDDIVFPMTMTKPPFVWCSNGRHDGLCD